MSLPLLTPDTAQKTIEFGGLTWQRKFRDGEIGCTYRTIQPGIATLCIYQYPDGYNAGAWHASASFYEYLPDNINPKNLSADYNVIKKEIDDAMTHCINALDDWLDDMQRTLAHFRQEDSYSQGFRAGQEDIKHKIAEVIA